MAETKYVCVPERWLTSDQLAAAPQSHVAVTRELLGRMLPLADIALWKDTSAELRSLLAKE